MTNKQKIIVSIPFYVVCAAIAGFLVSLMWAFVTIRDTYKKDEPVGEMWSELDPT